MSCSMGGKSPIAADDLSMLVARGLLEQIAASLRLHESISVKLGKIQRNNRVLRLAQLSERPVEPRAGADTVARVDRRLARASLRAEIGMPGVTARAYFLRERQAVRVGARQSAEISTFAQAYAGHEESHPAGKRLRAAGGRRDALRITAHSVEPASGKTPALIHTRLIRTRQQRKHVAWSWVPRHPS